MLKYLAIFAVIFTLAVYIARQDQLAATESAQKTAHLDQSAIPAKADEKQPQENVPKTRWHTPSWLIGFFRWPNGTTTWAVILTLMAIAEQTKETAKAAKAAEKSAKATEDSIPHQEKAAEAALLNAQAVINAERAWITVTPHIGSPKFYPMREKNAPVPEDLVDVLPIAHLFAGKLVNVGKTPAKIEAAAIRYVRTPIHPSKWNASHDYGDIVENVLFAFPNEVNTITAELSPTATMTQAQIEAVQNGNEFLYAFGIVKYRDVYGNPHETRFGYLYQVQDRHLVMKDNGVIETIRTGEARFRTGGPPEYNGHT